MQQPTWSSPVQTPQPPPPPPPPGNGAATAALILDILSLLVSVGIFALFQSVGHSSAHYVSQAWVLLLIGSAPALPAIICGHVGLARARISNGLRGGEGRAATGMVFGYFYAGLIIILLMVLITAPTS